MQRRLWGGFHTHSDPCKPAYACKSSVGEDVLGVSNHKGVGTCSCVSSVSVFRWGLWVCYEDIWNTWQCFSGFYVFHSICRGISTGQSYSYGQERKSIIFPKLFFLKFPVYILKRYPQALGQNQYIFMLRPILPDMAISFRRSKQIKRGKCC